LAYEDRRKIATVKRRSSLLGGLELAAGHVTPKILVPVGLEVAMSLAFLYVGRGQSLRSH
jgi:hypothetical protein